MSRMRRVRSGRRRRRWGASTRIHRRGLKGEAAPEKEAAFAKEAAVAAAVEETAEAAAVAEKRQAAVDLPGNTSQSMCECVGTV